MPESMCVFGATFAVLWVAINLLQVAEVVPEKWECLLEPIHLMPNHETILGESVVAPNLSSNQQFHEHSPSNIYQNLVHYGKATGVPPAAAGTVTAVASRTVTTTNKWRSWLVGATQRHNKLNKIKFPDTFTEEQKTKLRWTIYPCPDIGLF